VKFETLVGYSDEQFRRITGVKRVTFEKTLEILRCAFAHKHAHGGRKPKLPLEEQLLATLEYIREYRMYAHIAASYQIDESSMYRMIRWVEDTLVKDGVFFLSGRKALLKNDVKYEVVLIDATEFPIECLKKSKNVTTVASTSVLKEVF
jgi:hypothetical protein